MLVYLIGLVITSLVVGGLARLAIPGKQDLSIPATIGLGFLGSLAGGLIGRLLFRNGFGLILAVACGAGLLWLATKKGWVRTTR